MFLFLAAMPLQKIYIRATCKTFEISGRDGARPSKTLVFTEMEGRPPCHPQGFCKCLISCGIFGTSVFIIDKSTVWDSAGGGKDGSSTSNFVSSLIKSIPPLQDVAGMAGVELPFYLGKMTTDDNTDASVSPPV